MQIRKERQESSLRITKAEIAISKAVEEAFDADSETHIEEMVVALLNQATWWQRHLVTHAIGLGRDENEDDE